MDYDTFVEKFPSEVFLAKYFISFSQFKRRFLFAAYTQGLLRIGLSDVRIAQLAEKRAIISVLGIPVIVPWRFDVRPYYDREVRSIGQRFLSLIATIVHRMQDGIYPKGSLVIDASGISVGDTRIAYTDCEESLGVPKEVLSDLFIEMRTILSHEPLSWKRIGLFTSSGGMIHCTIYERSKSQLLPDPPEGWVRAKRIERI